MLGNKLSRIAAGEMPSGVDNSPPSEASASWWFGPGFGSFSPLLSEIGCDLGFGWQALHASKLRSKHRRDILRSSGYKHSQGHEVAPPATPEPPRPARPPGTSQRHPPAPKGCHV